ncbi:MAG: hypothetical protein IJS43_06140 [Bacteroidaceae bacterium]|nr:hypothetical protein [Bacteroidaceae bacterium]
MHLYKVETKHGKRRMTHDDNIIIALIRGGETKAFGQLGVELCRCSL